MSSSSFDFSALVKDRTLHFTGRDWVFSKIDKWLTDSNGSRAFLLLGSPGTGKSTILARLVQFSEGQAFMEHCLNLAPGFLAYHHFCQAQQDATLIPLRFVEALSLALAQRYQTFARALVESKHGDTQITINATQRVQTARDGSRVQNIAIENLNLGSASARAAFDLTVRKPLEALCTTDFKENIVILVDSLDEAGTWQEKETILTLLGETLDDPRDLPPQVRFVLASRPDERVLQGIVVPAPLDLIADAPPDAQEVRQYAANRLAKIALESAVQEVLTSRLAEASSGNFLYARYVLDDWLSRPAEIALISATDLPSGLSDIYGQFLKRELTRDEEKWEDRYQLLLGLLAVARGEGLTPAALAGASGNKLREINNALRACAQYLAGPDPEGRYRIYHQSFRDFLLDDASYRVYPGEANQALVDFFVREYEDMWHTCNDEYAVDYTTAHLLTTLYSLQSRTERQRYENMLASLLTDYGYLQARINRGRVYELIGEYRQALQLLKEDHPWRNVLDLLAEILRSDTQFISDHPESFFQSCWNRGWWYDVPQAASFYEQPAGGWEADQTPWNRPGGKLHTLLEGWRKQRQKTGTASEWLRALRPPPDPLGNIQLAVFLGHGDESFEIDISSDERRLVSGGGEDWGNVKLYTLGNGGEVLSSIRFEDGEYMQAIAYSPRGDVIAVALGDDSLRLLDPQRLEELDRLSAGDHQPDTTGGIHSLAFSPNGRTLISGHGNGELIAWDIDSHQMVTRVEAHQSWVESLAFSADGSELASADRGSYQKPSSLSRWRFTNRQFQHVQSREFKNPVTCLAYSQDGRLLACAPYSEEIFVYDQVTNEMSQFQVNEGEHTECLAFTPDGKSLLAGAGDVFSTAHVYSWDLQSGELKWKLPAHNFLVSGLIVFQNGERLVTAGDNTIRIWNLERISSGFILNNVEPDIDHAIFSPDGDFIYTASEKSETVFARSVTDGRLAHRYSDHEGGVFSLVISQDGNWLACGCGSGAVRVWNVESRSEHMIFTAHELVVEALAFSPDGTLLATGSQDGTARLLELKTRKEVGVITAHQDGWVQEVSFSPDGQLLLTGDFDHLIIWNTASLEKVGEYKSERMMTYYSTCFTNDSRFVVIEGVGGAISAWEVAAGTFVPVQDSHQQAYYRLKMRRPSPYTWEKPEEEDETFSTQRPELVLRRAESGDPVARLPVPYGGILYHPTQDIWGVRRGGHLYLYSLETS